MKPQNQNNKNDLFSGFDKRLKKKDFHYLASRCCFYM